MKFELSDSEIENIVSALRIKNDIIREEIARDEFSILNAVDKKAITENQFIIDRLSEKAVKHDR